MEPMRVVRKEMRQNVAGSLNTKMPTNTVPTAPIPVQTAYAVPIGNVCVAFISSNILIESEIRNPANQRYISVPEVSFTLPKQDANATSNKPPMIRNTQFI